MASSVCLRQLNPLILNQPTLNPIPVQLDQKGSTVQHLSKLYLNIMIMIVKDCFYSSYFKGKTQILLGLLIFANFLDRIMFSLR